MKESAKKLSKQLRSSQRLTYPDDEARYSWLSTLLDAYHIVDVGISIELTEEEAKRKAKVACHQGCSNCCLRPTVPITSLELMGISWFATEKLKGNVRDTVKKQLLYHRQTTQCPFLVNSVCSIYLMRPIACRIFFIFGKPCQPGERVELTRPHDIWTHSRDVARQVAMTVLPFYGITGKRKKLEAFEDGYIHDISTPMHELPWEKIYKQMEHFSPPY